MSSSIRTSSRTLIGVAAIVAVVASAALVAFGVAPDRPVRADSAVLVGAGDIAECLNYADNSTAKLLDDIPGTVFTVGDNAYPSGTARQFSFCYGPTWGRHKARTKPAPGNHEYLTADASGYFGYFERTAGPPSRGYYSYDKSGWHVISLDSNCEHVGGCGANSPMLAWLKDDLATNVSHRCTLAYFHHPLFSSGIEHGNQPQVRPIWEVLYAANADVVLSAHDHDYERFAPQSPRGLRDAERGIREFVVGTGGGAEHGFGPIEANSQARKAGTPGVLKFTLKQASYEWRFVPVEDETYTDSGRGRCH